MATENDRVTEAQREEALRILRRDYWQDVRDVVEDLREEIKRGNLEPDAEAIDTWIHETIDGHQRVIYTHYARETLLFVDNPDAYEEEMGEKPQTVEQAAYFAFRKDVVDQIGNVDDLIAEFGPDAMDPIEKEDTTE